MSEDIQVYREVARYLYPDVEVEMTDEQVVQVAFAYAKGYRDRGESIDDEVLRKAVKRLSEIIEERIKSGKTENGKGV